MSFKSHFQLTLLGLLRHIVVHILLGFLQQLVHLGDDGLPSRSLQRSINFPLAV